MNGCDIVGAAMITAHGQRRQDVFAALCDGVVACGPLTHLDQSRYRGRRAYEIRFSTHPGLGLRSTGWLEKVVADAAREGGVDGAAERVTVLVGTGLREQASLERWHCEGGPLAVDEWNYRAAVKRVLGRSATVYTFVNACAAGLCCLALGLDLLELDEADAVIVAGTDSIASSMYGLLDRASPEQPDIITPFDACRKGVLMGEGAAAVVLRRGDGAPGYRRLARLKAVAQNCDARHETAPDYEGVRAAMKLAHSTAQKKPSDIGLVLAHGTGTQLNDATEAAALSDVFAGCAHNVMLSGIKALTGHTAGASGVIGVVTGIEIMNSGEIPPTPGLSQPMAAIRQFDYVQHRRTSSVDCIQVNAFGFGGVNAVAILERCA